MSAGINSVKSDIFPQICIESADFCVDVGKKRDLFAYIRKKL